MTPYLHNAFVCLALFIAHMCLFFYVWDSYAWVLAEAREVCQIHQHWGYRCVFSDMSIETDLCPLEKQVPLTTEPCLQPLNTFR